MKITGLETIVGEFVFAKVHTDEGITGIGGSHPVGKKQEVETCIRGLEGYLKGKDPFRIEHHWQAMYLDPNRRGAIVNSAIAAVDLAMWDIVGKSLGVPVYRLMGGPTRDRVKLVATTYAETPEEAVRKARAIVRKGFKALRITPIRFNILGGKTHHKPFQLMGHSELIGEVVGQVRAVREAVGDKIDIAVECLTRLRPYEAIALGRELEEYRILFLEDPTLWENVDVLAEVQRHLNLPIGTGERLFSLHDFRALMEARGVQILRPDVMVVGGLTNARKIAALAQANYVDMVPHNPTNRSGLLSVATAHFCASVNNVIAMEYDYDEHGDREPEITEPLEVKDGYLSLPQKPGLGVDLDEPSILRAGKAGKGAFANQWKRYNLRDDGGVWQS